MDIIVASNLNPAQKSEIQCIVDASREKESLSLSFPREDADLYVLLSLEGRIRSAAAFTEEGENIFECAAFTHPDDRNQGLFSAVLEAGLSSLHEDADLLFYIDENCRDAENVLYTLGAEHISDEYMMEIPLSRGRFPAMDTPGLEVSETAADKTPTLCFSDCHGSVLISLFDSHYYLYDFRIRESDRNQRYGTLLLNKVLCRLAERAELPVRLQVSGNNLPAMALYKKTGFRITETLSCYLY